MQKDKERLRQQCQKRLAEVHSGYQLAKRKYQEARRARGGGGRGSGGGQRRGKASLLAPAAHHLAALRARTFCSTHLSV